jgi:protein SCO1/2
MRAMIVALVIFASVGQAGAAGMLYRLPYPWQDENARSAPLSRFAGKPTVIAMSYGACQKICSTTMRRMEELQQLADRDGLDVNFVVISLDPKSDTPEAWREFRKWRGLTRQNWAFLSGSAGHTRILASYLGIGYWLYDDHVLHDFGITLLDADGNVLRTMKWADTRLEGFLPARLSGR